MTQFPGADDRLVRLGRRAGHPGRPEGLRPLRRARHVRHRRADRAEHPGRDRDPRAAARLRQGADRRGARRHRGRRRQDRHAVLRALIEAVADELAGRDLPLVVDPVMVASSGARLLLPDAVATLIARLFPLATVVTPNLPEAQALTGLTPRTGPRWPSGLVAMGAPRGPGHRRARRRARRPPLRRPPRHLAIPVARYDGGRDPRRGLHALRGARGRAGGGPVPARRGPAGRRGRRATRSRTAWPGWAAATARCTPCTISPPR